MEPKWKYFPTEMKRLIAQKKLYDKRKEKEKMVNATSDVPSALLQVPVVLALSAHGINFCLVFLFFAYQVTNFCWEHSVFRR